MSLNIIRDRLAHYSPQSKLEEWNALKEISQEIVLAALSRADFFKIAAFQGGTCLRIIHGLNRFSEDLDFILLKPDTSFEWHTFLQHLETEFESFGLSLEVTDRSKASQVVKKAFLKEDSFGKVLNLLHGRNSGDPQKIQIKLEIDTRPPSGSDFEPAIVNFPYPFAVTCQDLPSLFASKCHALLCRDHVKGRDWYDFVWYVTQGTQPNYTHLEAALFQAGPWAEQKRAVDKEWLYAALRDKINRIDWKMAKEDVMKFIKPMEQRSLGLWDASFFLAQLEKWYK